MKNNIVQPIYKRSYTLFLIPILLLLFNILWPYYTLGNTSMWDYEGFLLLYPLSMLIAILLLCHDIYEWYRFDKIELAEGGFVIKNKNDLTISYSEVNAVSTSLKDYTIHTSKGDFSFKHPFVKNFIEVKKSLLDNFDFKKVKRNNIAAYSIFTILALLLLSLVFSSLWDMKNQSFKYNLPLKKIETTQIEGTIAFKATISERDKEHKLGPVSASIHGDLEEFPNIYFRYCSHRKLKDNIINIEDTDSTKTLPFNKKTQRIPKGTKIKLRIRTQDYEDLKAYMATGEHLKERTKDSPYDPRRSITFYELALDDEILVQKYGLK